MAVDTEIDEIREYSIEEMQRFQSYEQKFNQLPRESKTREEMLPLIEKQRRKIMPYIATTEALPLVVFHVMIQTRHAIACAPALREHISEERMAEIPLYVRNQQPELCKQASLGTASLGTATRNKISQILFQKAAQFDIVSTNMKFHPWYKDSARGIFIFAPLKLDTIRMAHEFQRQLDRQGAVYDYPSKIYLCNFKNSKKQVDDVCDKLSKFVAAKNFTENYHVYMVFLHINKNLPFDEYMARLLSAMKENAAKTNYIFSIGGDYAYKSKEETLVLNPPNY